MYNIFKKNQAAAKWNKLVSFINSKKKGGNYAFKIVITGIELVCYVGSGETKENEVRIREDFYLKD